GDLANDDALARDRERALLLPNLRVVENPGQGLRNCTRVHDLPVDDHRRRERGVAEAQKADAFLGVFDLADLDRSRADIDSDQVLSFAHGSLEGLSSWRVVSRIKSLAPRRMDSQKTGFSQPRWLSQPTRTETRISCRYVSETAARSGDTLP